MKIPLMLFQRFLLLGIFSIGPVPVRAQRMELTEKNVSPVVVESAVISTEVTGRIAVTTFDLVFKNPNARVLEGNFVFPLLDGQSVVRFALDINGSLREAMPVEKTQGRVVFEEIERRRVDPGLLEQTEGNNYRARVFPIPAHGTRRIVLAYQEDLVRNAGEPIYRINLNFEKPLKTFRLSVVAFSDGTKEPKTRTTLGLDLPAWRDARFLDVEKTDFKARGLFELMLPPSEHARVITGKQEDKEYFYAEVQATGSSKARPAPRTVGLLWDSSGSGRERDHDKEFALLDEWFALVKNVDVQLIRLRDRAEAPVSFAIRDGKWSALKAELKKTVYDGATSFDGLADNLPMDEWLLFSDGLFNYGSQSAQTPLPLKGSVHAILACGKADPAQLRCIAARHNGEFVNLLETESADSAKKLRAESLRVIAVNYDPETVAQIFPEPGTPITAESLVVTGLLRVPQTSIRVRIGHNNSDARDHELVLCSGENPSRLAARAWATTKLNLLSLNPTANREDIRRTSQDFGIVTANTSLIVLETLADYVRYNITPPAELRNEWRTVQNRTEAERKNSFDIHFDAVLRAFKDRVAWWEKKFPKDEPPKTTNFDKVIYGDAERMAAPASVRAGSSDDVIVLNSFSVSQAPAGRRQDTQRERREAVGRITALEAKRKGDSADDASTPTATISLQSWKPNAGYLDHLRRTSPEKAYTIYLEERADHTEQPGFFLDVANYFFEVKQPELALRILSNLAEMELEDVALLRVLAHRLTQADRPDLAKPLFERVLILRPDEPQSHRDLALVCAATKEYQRAVDLLWVIVFKPWDGRFPEIEQLALAELNAIVSTCDAKLDLSKIDRRLLKNLPVTTRVILTWDANDCDIDLWVTDPNGEVAMYNHPLTYQGGHMSRDFTGGYGPEEFILRTPKPGKYKVQINYFGDRRQNALGPVTAQVRLITHFGTREQKEERITVRLKENKETLDIGGFEISP
ncbi:MAG: VIT domain-containing protein [Nibricoccus sp.]